MNNLNQRLNKIEQDKRRILSNYQKERHLELLKRSEELRSLSINASEEALELSGYSRLLNLLSDLKLIINALSEHI
jgi:hypothetical protein